jgi:hypothetical protein
MADISSLLGSAGIGGAIGAPAGWTARARGDGLLEGSDNLRAWR